MTKAELIKYYENNLKKVKETWNGAFRGKEYIEYAENILDAAKNDRLMEFFEKNK